MVCCAVLCGAVVRHAWQWHQHEKQRFDMFHSMKRVASLEMSDCFFGNSNSRGVVLSVSADQSRSLTSCTVASPAGVLGAMLLFLLP